MILELDCGNSFIKWRVIHVADAVIEGGGIVDSDQALVAEVAALASVRLTGCRIVSVRIGFFFAAHTDNTASREAY